MTGLFELADEDWQKLHAIGEDLRENTPEPFWVEVVAWLLPRARLGLDKADRVASLSAALEEAKLDTERIAHVQAFPDEVTWCQGLLGGPGAWSTYVGNANGRGLTTFPTWREAVDASLKSLRAWAAVDHERFAAFPHLRAALPSGDATRGDAEPQDPGLVPYSSEEVAEIRRDRTTGPTYNFFKADDHDV